MLNRWKEHLCVWYMLPHEVDLHGTDLTDFAGRKQPAANFSEFQLRVRLHTWTSFHHSLFRDTSTSEDAVCWSDKTGSCCSNLISETKTPESCSCLHFLLSALWAADVIVTVPPANYAARIVSSDIALFRQISGSVWGTVSICASVNARNYYLMWWVSAGGEWRAEMGR